MKGKIIVGQNDLATTHPKLVEQWHPEKNLPLSPEQTTANSSRNIWWKCEHGHEWQRCIPNRAFHDTGCPYCKKRSAIPGENDLSTTHPRIAAEWHPTKNHPLLVTDVTEKTNKKVWWSCKEGHEWESRIDYRCQKENICPLCNSIGRIGETRIMNNGMSATIIAYHNAHNIDVKFSDGYIAKGIRYYYFLQGAVKNPNITVTKKTHAIENYAKRRVGESVITKDGEMVTLIEYLNSRDCTVRFHSNNAILSHISYRNFHLGNIKNPERHVGLSKIANNGMMMTIIVYRSSLDIDVQFSDGTIVTNRTMSSFRTGSIRNPSVTNHYK